MHKMVISFCSCQNVMLTGNSSIESRKQTLCKGCFYTMSDLIFESILDGNVSKVPYGPSLLDLETIKEMIPP